MPKMGDTEKRILQSAKRKKREGKTYKSLKKTDKRSLKNCVEKGWLERVDIGEFYITDRGEQALTERVEEEEKSGEKGIGDFA